MGLTHFDGVSVGSSGLAVGTASAGETVVITSAGAHQTTAGTELTGAVALSIDLVAGSTAAVTYYTVAPIAGDVTGYAVWQVSAGTGRAVTVTVGSAGAELLQMSALGASGTIGAVSTLSNTSGTTAVTAGQAIKVALASCATAQVEVGCTLVFTPTA